MISRDTESATTRWGRRQRRNGRDAHGRSPGTTAPEFSPAAVARARRQGGPPQDEALYACPCGYLFAALVSTSVECPGCGDTQAW